MGKGPENTFSQRSPTGGHDAKCSTSLVIREMQIKATRKYRLTPVRTAVIKRTRGHTCWCACGGYGALVRCWWACKVVKPVW